MLSLLPGYTLCYQGMPFLGYYTFFVNLVIYSLCYPGMLFLTRACFFLPGYARSYPGIMLSLLPVYAFSYQCMLIVTLSILYLLPGYAICPVIQ